MQNFNVGDIVVSIAGRDIGVRYIVYKINSENEILVVDGKSHKLSNPKKKNIKHVKYLDVHYNSLAEKIVNKEYLLDAEIKKMLKF